MNQRSGNDNRRRKPKIKKAQEGDKRVVKAIEELKKAGIKTLKDEK